MMNQMNIVHSINNLILFKSCDNHYVIKAVTQESKEIQKFENLVKEVK